MSITRNTYYESYADEANITTTDSDGDEWQTVSVAGTSTIKADTAIAINYGSATNRAKTMRFATDGSASALRTGYDFGAGGQAVMAWLAPFYMVARPGTDGVFAMGLSVGFATVMKLRMQSDGTIEMVDAADAVRFTSTTALAASTVYWLGLKVKGHALLGYMELKIWSSTGTLLETVGDTTADEVTAGSWRYPMFGGEAFAAASWTYHWGEIWVDDTDYPALPTLAGTAALTGTAVTGGVLESEIVAGGQTIIITLTNDTWVATVGDDNAITTALIAGIDSGGAGAAGWDAVVKAHMTHAHIVRTSATVVTITLAAEATYAITANETITVTIPATALTGAGAVVASPTFAVTNETPAGGSESRLLLGVG